MIGGVVMEISLQDLGLSGSPSENIYKNLAKFSNFLLNTVLVNTFEMSGTENLKNDCLQMFLCNHLYYTDPVLAQMAIILASGNDNPIPAPAYKSYVKHKVLGPIMVGLYSFPIYGKEDGYTEKENSLQYGTQCFMRQERILLFPEGQIVHDGKMIDGKLGSPDICSRAFHFINNIKKNEYPERIEIVPMNISYYPVAGIPLSNMGKISIRFGVPIDFKTEFIDKFYSPFYCFMDEDKLRKHLYIKLIDRVMKEIGTLTTININQIVSWVIHHMCQRGNFVIDKYKFDNIIFDIIDVLRKESNFYLIDHLRDDALFISAYDNFLNLLFEKNIALIHSSRRRESILAFNMHYVLGDHDFASVRNNNIILYNRNLIDHLTNFKKMAVKKIYSKT